MVAPQQRHKIKRYYERQFLSKVANTYNEFIAICADGREIWLGQNVQIIKENDQIIGFQAVARDITERKQAEELVRKANEQLTAQLVEIKVLQDKLREEAIRDSLTGLFNRRYMNETAHSELARAKRSNLPVGIIIMDIDHFKKVNDTHGHQGGDLLLQAFANLLRSELRAGDIICRFGGEEFVAILPDAFLKDIKVRAEQLRSSFENMRVLHQGRDIHTTLSIGIAMFPEHGKSEEEILLKADRALYAAKQSGRNRIVISE